MKTIFGIILSLVLSLVTVKTFAQDQNTLHVVGNKYTYDEDFYVLDEKNDNIMLSNHGYINLDSSINIDNLNFNSVIGYTDVSIILKLYSNEQEQIDFYNSDNDTLNSVYDSFHETYVVNLSTYYQDPDSSKNVNELSFDKENIDSIEILGIGIAWLPYVAVIATIIIDNDNTANIEEYVKVTDVNVYPNPVINLVTIDFETDLQDVPVELYSLNGQLLQTNNDNRYFGRNSVQMEMYDYPKGMYLIKVGDEVRKIVKQ